MSEKKENQQGFNIELSEEVSEGTYSNLAIIQHSSSEFIFDFVRIMPGVPKGKVKSRIVMTPEHAKKLMRALNDNISKYESNIGSIREDNLINPIPLNFGGPDTQA
ncbi:MAG: DUF3467 domain-containing protein [Bacteroidota bacterium]|nr:DUF3467 domain-containing protein [Bacteroidota bacterium]